MKVFAPLCLLLVLNVPVASAQSGTRVEHHAMGDFLAGELEGLTVGPVGELGAAPVGLERYFTPSLYVWALSLDRNGRILAGAGDEGSVLRLEGEEFVELAQMPGELVLDVADTGEEILAASGPEGRIYRIEGEESTVLVEREEATAWALASSSRKGRWLAGYGPDAVLVRFDASSGEQEVVAGYAASVIRRLLRDGDRLWLATQAPALIFESTDDTDHPDLLRYDAGNDEIPAIVADGDGGLWFVVLDPGDPDAMQPPVSRLLHLPREGSAEQVWQGELAIMSLARGADGALLLGEIGASRVHRVTPDGRIGLWRDFGEGDASALLVDGETTWIGSSNLGDVFRLTAPKDGRGTFTSKPVATPAVATWGRLWVEGDDRGVRFSVRSGMRSQPDETWSAWSGWRSSGDRIEVPLADYLQYRISLEDAEVTGVNVSWARRNHAPRVRGIRFEGAASASDAYGNGGGNGASLPFLRRNATVSVDANDPDRDRLRVTVEVSRAGEDRWVPLQRDGGSMDVAWDTQQFADGTWRARATVSDLHESTTLVSTPVVVDNAIPRMARSRRQGDVLEVRIEDEGSRLAAVELRFDGEDRWIPIEPVDGVVDGAAEDFTIALAEGAVAVWIRATDAAGNEAVFSPRLDD